MALDFDEFELHDLIEEGYIDELDLTNAERQMIADQAGSLSGDWAHGNAIDSIPSKTNFEP